MTRRRARLTWPLLLLAACGAVSARLYDEWRQAPTGGESAPAAATAGGAATPASASAAALALPPPEQFAVIVDRPLFAQTRRPPPPAPPPTAEPPPAESEAPPPPVAVETSPSEPPPAVDFTLVGIVTDGTERHALVQRQSDGTVVEVPEGGDISGWFAVLIDPERAVFRQGATEAELVLHFDAPVPAGLIPPPRPKAAPPAPAPASNGPVDQGAPPQ
jgi:hypothetical protein